MNAEQVLASEAANTGAGMLEAAYAFHEAHQFEDAAAIYDQLLTQNHDNPGLLATMGTLYLQTGRYGMALSLLHRAASQTPSSDIFCSIGTAYKYLMRYKESHQYFRKAIDHNPTASSFANYAALFIESDPDKALDLTRKALKIEPDHANAQWHQAMVYLGLGNWAEGWDKAERGFDARMRIRRNIADTPYWDGTNGKTIAVYGEQGIGDEIMFASMLPDLMAKNDVIFECHPRLKTLFEKSFPGLICYGTRDKKEIVWQNDHHIDYSVSIGSLGSWFRRDRSHFPGTPYLKAEALPRSDKFRVGISWIGGMKQGRIRTRSIPLAWWKSILNVPNCEFVSLQYTDAQADIDGMEAQGYDIHVMDEYVKADDYYETARLVASCDLVISVATSVYHLAGALGVPAWVMVPNAPPWREQQRGGSPWYRSVRLYRQPAGGMDSWVPVLQKVGYDLSELMDELKKRIAA